MCGTLQQSKERSTVKGSGDVKAELSKLAKLLGDFGIDGKATFESERFQGVLQSRLAEALQDEKHRELTVVTSLMNKIDQHMLGIANKPRVKGIADSIDEGNKISYAFVKDNNPQEIRQAYTNLSLKSEQFLRDNLDIIAAIHFSRASFLAERYLIVRQTGTDIDKIFKVSSFF